ncbi:hypothetical protein [uncultured Flavobacterium sp.]|uniref:hypothetical protein n=1 Tax=uncultured Flavobacterium sp. TaxID=165435 RepID=UPI00262813FC|nr:hypothetical protein [uncultured Flavobacterium sp.]
MKKNIITFLALIVISIGNAQEKIDLNSLYKEWKLETLEKNGKIKNAEEFDKDESIIFYKNNKFKMNDSEQTMNGIWKFNYLTNTIELTLVDINQKIKLKLLKLNSEELDYISEDDDSTMIFHFKPKIKK